ncbi:hypothetical protein BDN72DRAFT_764670 [Pluteus cervinus]|uniref:Uncharacterized protein n=1 Tax=Pluteus cervinus TaxID=181527 RepID=A0ACD3B232_9AGAR|nr:hypothetical protein BDN72DRAFT_764670 [Pluteus cervinus]
MASSKRPRTPSRRSSENISSPDSQAPTHKASRTSASPGPTLGPTNGGTKGFQPVQEHSDETQVQQGTPQHPLLCTLPPTCNRKPTPLENSRDLEAHYAKYHAHVCEERGCGCVFPDERLLELHQTECHDPLAAVRKDRGDKIFECHQQTCGRFFQTPKARRLHLIQGHGYPKEYFFAVTNKGIGGLLKKWGDGASMIRREWKPRSEKGGKEDEDRMDEDHEGSGSDEEDNESEASEATANNKTVASTRKATTNAMETDEVDGLVNSLDSLSLVPTHVRFGRGGKASGFVGHNNHNNNTRARGGGRGGTRGQQRGGGRGGGGYGGGQVMDVDVGPGPGLGWASRGRAGVVGVAGRGRGGRGGRARGS